MEAEDRLVHSVSTCLGVLDDCSSIEILICCSVCDLKVLDRR